MWLVATVLDNAALDVIGVILKLDLVTGINWTLNELKDGEKCQMGVWI